MSIARSLPVLLLSLIFLSSCSLFRSASSGDSSPARSSGESSGSGYSSIVTDDAVSSEGVLDVHYVGNDIFYEIPDSLLGRDFLMVSRVAKVPSAFFGYVPSGSKTAEQVFVFEKAKGKVNIRQRSYNSVAADSLPIYKSVQANNYEPI